MNKALFLAVAVATTTLAGSPSAQAYNDGPWCAVYSIGPGTAAERCDYRDFESCRLEIVAGNRGFCRQNGYWQGAQATAPRLHKHKHVRH